MTLRGSSSSLSARLAAAGLDWIVPDWPAPPQVCALSTTRNAGAGVKFDLTRSQPEFETARSELRRWLPADPIWLAQVHGIAICGADAVSAAIFVHRLRLFLLEGHLPREIEAVAEVADVHHAVALESFPHLCGDAR